MKARDTISNEIIEVTKVDSPLNLWVDNEGYHHYESDLDFVNVPKDIDWEMRRYEVAKEIFAYNYDCNAECAVRQANELIEELKKQKDEK